MHTLDNRWIAAPPDRVFELAVRVEEWPRILSHYRWVKSHGAGGMAGATRVEMAAYRPFGPFNWPTWWESEMWTDPERRQVRYRHVRGVTRGMDVLWTVEPHGEGTMATIVHDWTGPRWPLIGSLAASWVIGPVFVSGIASRTLMGIGRAAEALLG
jgi:hypothetical protein